MCWPLASASVGAAPNRLAWRVPIYWESYCAAFDSDGTEIGKAESGQCSSENLFYGWKFLGNQFTCVLKSKTDDGFYVKAKTEDCGVPENGFYRWSRRGIGERDFSCALWVKGNDTFHVWVDPSFCAGKFRHLERNRP